MKPDTTIKSADPVSEKKTQPLFAWYRFCSVLIITLRWKIKRAAISLFSRVELQQRSAVDLLKLDEPDGRSLKQAAMERAWLMRVIPKVPWWYSGHLAFGEASLVLEDFESAYGASQTAAQSLDKDQRVKAMLLEAQVMHRTGDFERAEPLLRAALEQRPTDHAIKELLISIVTARGDLDEAEKLLDLIPQQERSMSHHVMQSYCEKKRSGQLP